MLARILFCAGVSLAILVVVLLALLSPHSKTSSEDHARPWLALSLYIQHPQIGTSSNTQRLIPPPDDIGAFIFHHKLTEGPKNTSRVVGNAQGFIVPTEHFAKSPFNIIYLTFDDPGYSGSLSVQAKHVKHKEVQELMVVGGTGYFAFARGFAVFAEPSNMDASYHLKLHLSFPYPAHTIPR